MKFKKKESKSLGRINEAIKIKIVSIELAIELLNIEHEHHKIK